MILTLNPFACTPEPVDPIGPETSLSNYASELYIEGLADEALPFAEQALKIARTVPTLLNMSIILEDLSRFDEAHVYAAEAYLVNPNDKRTVGHYGRSLLRQGDLARGWPLYLQDCNLRPQLSDFIPEWTGQDLNGKRILVVEGEGYGDNVYFMRWLHELSFWDNGNVDYICQPSLAPLVEQMGFRALPNWGGNVDFKFTDYDYYTSILTLPHKRGVTYENYEWPGPYIEVGPIREADIGAPLRVGICSLAGESMSKRHLRSLHASQLQPMMNALDPRHKWVNLHHHYILPSSVDHPVVDNWLDTAKAIATCDLVVSVDTCVAHLAGAMGVPVWVILPGASSWQYPLYRKDHPFYPSMRMFRNQTKGIDYAVQFITAELNKL